MASLFARSAHELGFASSRGRMTTRLLARLLLCVLLVAAVAREAAAQTEPGTSSPAPAAPTASPSPSPEPVQEVTVHGARQDPGSEELTTSEVKQLPGAFGDAFRSIEAMPGVTPLVSGLPYFLVRGAPPGNTGFFIDGVPVPALFHLGVGAAVVHPSLVDRVDFYPGGYPARFGRFTGGILSGELATLPDHAHEEASVRLIDAGGLVSTPFADGRGDVMASGRYGYPGPVVSLIDPSVGLSYWDYQTRVRWRLDADDEISTFAFGSYDSLSTRDSTTGGMDQVLGIQFHRVDPRWDHRTGPSGSLRVAVTLGYDRTAAGNGRSTTTALGNPANPTFVTNPATEDSIQSESVRLRAEWAGRLSPDVALRVGSDAVAQPYAVDLAIGGLTLPASTPGVQASRRSTSTAVSTARWSGRRPRASRCARVCASTRSRRAPRRARRRSASPRATSGPRSAPIRGSRRGGA